MTESIDDPDPLERLRMLAANGQDYDAVALSWVMSVAAQEELDIHPNIISEPGAAAVKDVQDLDRYQHGEKTLTDELAERHRQAELAVDIRAITNKDPGVREKNALLVCWADLFDDVRVFERKGIDPNSDQAKNIRQHVQTVTTHYLDVFVHLQKQIEATAPDVRDLMVRQQFLGLWAVYKTGQATAPHP